MTTLTSPLATKLGIVVFLTPVFVLPGILVFLIGGMCGNLYIASQLALKCQQSVAKTAVLAHFSGMLSGLGRSHSLGFCATRKGRRRQLRRRERKNEVPFESAFVIAGHPTLICHGSESASNSTNN